MGESNCICEAFCDSRGSRAKPEILPQVMLANPEEDHKSENERTARANQTSAALSLRLAALATFSITNLNLKLAFQGLSCIVGNVGMISLHKRRMNGTSIFAASIKIFFFTLHRDTMLKECKAASVVNTQREVYCGSWAYIFYTLFSSR